MKIEINVYLGRLKILGGYFNLSKCWVLGFLPIYIYIYIGFFVGFDFRRIRKIAKSDY